MGLGSKYYSLTSSYIELCVDGECLHIRLQECQDQLKMCLVVQNGLSEAVSMKMHFSLLSHTLLVQAD